MLWSKLSLVILLQAALSFLLGRAAIPLLRQLKTGRYEPYIGDRFEADGSEPSFGGAVTCFVFAFGISVSAAVCGGAAQLFPAAVYVIAVTLPGIFDDVMTDVRRKPYLVKSSIKLGWCYSASLVFLLICERMGYIGTAVLLPFRLGFLELGKAFCPVMAAVMTLLISSYNNMNCFGTDDDTCVDGLCQTVAFVQASAAAVIGTIIKNDTFTVFGYSAAAACGGSLIWGLSPAKLKNGASGGYVCGGLAAAALCFCRSLELALLMCSLAAITDSVCTAVQLAVYKKSKKFMLKGSSLHAHMKAKGMNVYKIIAAFALFELIACAGAVIFAFYSLKIMI